MEAYKKLQEIRDELEWTDEDLVQFVIELNAYTEDVLGVKNEDSSNSTGYSDEERFLREILKELGVPTHIKGYYYTITAVLLCIEDSNYMDAITKELYPTIAKKYNTTGSRVERAIRHAVEVIWLNGNIDLQEKMFSYSISAAKGKPTNSHFITTLAEYVKINLPKWRSGTWEP